MTDRMPKSPIVDGGRNALPEWREYLTRTNETVRKIENLLASVRDNPEIAAVKARLEALQARVDNLPNIAVDATEKLLLRRILNTETGTDQTFTHEMDTRHVWWQIRRLSDGQIMTRAEACRVISRDNLNFRLELEASVNPGEVEAVIIGVISDRY